MLFLFHDSVHSCVIILCEIALYLLLGGTSLENNEDLVTFCTQNYDLEGY